MHPNLRIRQCAPRHYERTNPHHPTESMQSGHYEYLKLNDYYKRVEVPSMNPSMDFIVSKPKQRNIFKSPQAAHAFPHIASGCRRGYRRGCHHGGHRKFWWLIWPSP